MAFDDELGISTNQVFSGCPMSWEVTLECWPEGRCKLNQDLAAHFEENDMTTEGAMLK